MTENLIEKLRYSARKLVRELGMLKLNLSKERAPQHWHTLIEIANEPNITIAKLGNLFLLSHSAMSRIIKSLEKDGLIISKNGIDKREKYLQITSKGSSELKHIDEFSHKKIRGALSFLTESDQYQIIEAMQKYASALEKSRHLHEKVKINTLSTSRAIRKQIVNLIETIQKNEFSLPIYNEINSCVLRAEEDFYYNKSYNFWYAVNDVGEVIGSIGLKKIDNASAEIKKFFVHADYRGKGISQKLFRSLIKAAEKHKFKHLYLGTVQTLERAKKFYEKCGFINISEHNLPVNFNKCALDTVFYKIETRDLSGHFDSIIDLA